MEPPDAILLVLVPEEPDATLANQDLKALLKRLLRAYGMRCVWLQDIRWEFPLSLENIQRSDHETEQT